MRLDKLVNECQEAIVSDIKEAIKAGLTYAEAYVKRMQSYFYIRSEKGGEIEVYAVHWDDEDKSSPNVEAFLKESLDDNVEWYQLEDELEDDGDEWNEHGFASATDYYEWRYG